MSGRFVRASKFRHVHAEIPKRDKCYSSIRAASTGEGNFVKVNGTFFACVGTGGGGPVSIQRREDFGRIDPAVLNVHSRAVFDLDFSPFADNVIATGGDDMAIRVTNFPDDLASKQTVDQTTFSLEGHQKKISFIHWHPTSSSVIGSVAFDNMVKIWDVEKQQATISFELDSSVTQPQASFEWNYNGSLIGIASKDKVVRVVDPRDIKAMTTIATPFTKFPRVVFAENHNRLIVVGSNAASARLCCVYDTRKLGEAMSSNELDQNAGGFMPYYDPDTSILYLGGKGDSTINLYEVVDDDVNLFYLTSFRSNEAQKGLGFAPKRGCDTKTCEIAVAYRLLSDRVEPLSMQVPRKSDQFAEDIYPDTYAGISVLSADEYFAGANKEPPTKSMRPSSDGNQVKAVAKPVKSVAQLERELEAAHQRIKDLEAEVAKLKPA